jgi:hypothetical protein
MLHIKAHGGDIMTSEYEYEAVNGEQFEQTSGCYPYFCLF